MKLRKVFNITFLFFAVTIGLLFCVNIIFGCGNNASSKSNTEYAAEYFDAACQHYFDIDYEEADDDLDTSIAYASTNEAWAFKAQLSYVTFGSSEADTDLASYEALYPNDGCMDLLHAYFACLNGTGEGSQLLSDLQTALQKDYAGLGYEGYWGFVEDFEGFSYFRENFPTEYASLEAQKTESLSVAASDGETKFMKFYKVGPALFIKHSDMPLLEVERQLEALIMSLVLPRPYNSLVSTAIKMRTPFIKSRDKGRGVRLQWTVASWVPSIGFIETFIALSQ